MANCANYIKLEYLGSFSTSGHCFVEDKVK